MNKKLFLKLVLLLLSLSLVACGQKNNSAKEDNSSKSSTSQFGSSTQSSTKESTKTTSPSVENKVESKQEDEDVQINIQQNNQPHVKQGLIEEEYYIIIKEAKQRQQYYIDSIDDSKVKQSVQTSYSAAIAESTALYMKYPEDTDTIDAALKRVLDGE